MRLNIKNPETDKLVRELAQLTGESLTDAVTVALAERLERVRREDLAARKARIIALAADAAATRRSSTSETALHTPSPNRPGSPRSSSATTSAATTSAIPTSSRLSSAWVPRSIEDQGEPSRYSIRA